MSTKKKRGKRFILSNYAFNTLLNWKVSHEIKSFTRFLQLSTPYTSESILTLLVFIVFWIM
jgi:hypothetical protein